MFVFFRRTRLRGLLAGKQEGPWLQHRHICSTGGYRDGLLLLLDSNSGLGFLLNGLSGMIRGLLLRARRDKGPGFSHDEDERDVLDP